MTTDAVATDHQLRQRLDALDALRDVATQGHGVIAGVPQGAVALVAWWLRETLQRHVVLIASEPELVYTDCAVFAPEESVVLFPGADTMPFDRVAPSEEITRHRLRTLKRLAEPGPVLLVTSAAGLLRPTLSPESIRHGVTALVPGQIVDRDDVVRRLIALGYQRQSAVSSPGDCAVRGGIVDVFGMDERHPWRAEWSGNRIGDIRVFDVATQATIRKASQVQVGPARELDLHPEVVERAVARVDALDLSTCREDIREVWQRCKEQLREGIYDDGLDLLSPYMYRDAPLSLVDHLEDAVVLFVGGREKYEETVRHYCEEADDLLSQEVARGELPGSASSGLLSAHHVNDALSRFSTFDIVREALDTQAAINLEWGGAEAFGGRLDALADGIRKKLDGGDTVIILSSQQHRVEEITADYGLTAVDVTELSLAETPLPLRSLLVANADLSSGFVIDDAHMSVFTDSELFGMRKQRGSLLLRGRRRVESTSGRGARRAATGSAARDAFILQLQPGDLVVHRDHGIGRFIDMRRVEDDGGMHEYMTIEYADGERLFVPVEHLDRVARYVGGSDTHPNLSRLGTGEWERTKRRVKERTEEVARELLALYSKRELAKGHAFSPDGLWQRELEGSFPYQETPDQLLVLDEIKRDMEASKPMDRIVCGDVGFGKTELALRAAFKAVSEGRQVAVLVPTTVLAQQHFLTFRNRLSAFPVTVQQLSRFCTDDQIRQTLSGLKTGGVDIVIGTHRLLQRDVEFNNLGLVIVDEEQRFGVLQKEKFKELRVAVDLLSLSATPIPRTLHMSLAGIRDLSVIQTPPEERQPIKTYVVPRDDGLIREVISRELARNGQVYYLHNRVQSIEREADCVRELAPHARVAIAHGQMSEEHLAAAMQKFTDGEVDVLVATTIIEAGLDIPNVNTIVINDAHRFGLAQLYQLRGRVGRAGKRAYAYMMYPAQKALSEKADKRLEVIGDLQDLGSGFKLAMRDLEIRGAGNLLGEDQHGEIAAVGLELYNHLIGQSVAALQGKPVVESPAKVTVSLPLAALIPASYVDDEALRLRCYQELAACVTEVELENRVQTVVDRFGPLPMEVDALAYSLKVRLLAAACGATSLAEDRGGVVVQFPLGHTLDLESVARQYRTWLTTSATRMFMHDPQGKKFGGKESKGEWQEMLVRVLRELGRLRRSSQAVPVDAHAR